MAHELEGVRQEHMQSRRELALAQQVAEEREREREGGRERESERARDSERERERGGERDLLVTRVTNHGGR